MSQPEILIRLRDLHEELTAINLDLKTPSRIDDETVEALGQLVTDVGQLVDNAQSKVEDKPEISLKDELIDRIADFEVEHPRVANLLTQLTDVVAMIGI